MSKHLKPSRRARELVEGAFDTHLHLSPDIIERSTSDLELAKRCQELGIAGFVLKSHYVPTSERAAVVRAAVPGVDVRGSITLNRAVGGLNPIAVDVAARGGAAIVWLPTFDSMNETLGRRPIQDGASIPAWARLQHEMRAAGIASDPIEILTAGGDTVPELRSIARIVASHDMVLATGHLSRDEIFAAVDVAKEAGVRRIVITHPEFPSQRIPLDDQIELARRDCLLERCFTTPYTGKVSWEVFFANIRAVGIEHSVVSSDLGQLHNPPAEDGLALMAEQLLKADFTEAEIRTMIVDNSRSLMQITVTA